MSNELKITYEDIENLPEIVILPTDIERITNHLVPEQMDGFYRRIRRQIGEWAKAKGAKHKHVEYILLAPDFFVLLARLLVDDRVPAIEKGRLGAAIAYFILPLDVVPEILLGPAGYIDDLVLAAFVLNSLLKNTPEHVLRGYWEGSEDVIVLIRQITAKTEEFLTSEVWQRVKRSLQARRTGSAG